MGGYGLLPVTRTRTLHDSIYFDAKVFLALRVVVVVVAVWHL